MTNREQWALVNALLRSRGNHGHHECHDRMAAYISHFFDAESEDLGKSFLEKYNSKVPTQEQLTLLRSA